MQDFQNILFFADTGSCLGKPSRPGIAGTQQQDE